MIILDTNVISELMKTRPNAAVRAWADAQRRDQLVTTAITIMELTAGVAILRPGKRRDELAASIDWVIDDQLKGRVLNFDRRAAIAAAELYAARRTTGRTIDLRDTQIGGIAISRRIPVATRNTLHFEDLPVKTINPWQFR